MKKIINIKTITFCSFLLLLITFYIKISLEDKGTSINSGPKIADKTLSDSLIKINVSKLKNKKSDIERAPQKAYVESVTMDPETNLPVYKMHIPKGKRLYDEEKMKEFAIDATIETMNIEDHYKN